MYIHVHAHAHEGVAAECLVVLHQSALCATLLAPPLHLGFFTVQLSILHVVINLKVFSPLCSSYFHFLGFFIITTLYRATHTIALLVECMYVAYV